MRNPPPTHRIPTFLETFRDKRVTLWCLLVSQGDAGAAAAVAVCVFPCGLCDVPASHQCSGRTSNLLSAAYCVLFQVFVTKTEEHFYLSPFFYCLFDVFSGSLESRWSFRDFGD